MNAPSGPSPLAQMRARLAAARDALTDAHTAGEGDPELLADLLDRLTPPSPQPHCGPRGAAPSFVADVPMPDSAGCSAKVDRALCRCLRAQIADNTGSRTHTNPFRFHGQGAGWRTVDASRAIVNGDDNFAVSI
ncbi:MAG: hypothetical protein OXF33_00200 [Rhodospirillales bacterium]|nr:hypothetical protein [Rhodospirillales bacterium]MCY4002120.1 hypothetical protein [Rhodospirillales bacterium]